MTAIIRPTLTSIALPGSGPAEIVREGLVWRLYVPCRAVWAARLLLDATDEVSARGEAAGLGFEVPAP